MGSVIEEHTTQLDGIERKERLLSERAEELKEDKNNLVIESEKCRQIRLQYEKLERRLNQDKERPGYR